MPNSYEYNLLIPDRYVLPVLICFVGFADFLFFQSTTPLTGTLPYAAFYLGLLLLYIPHTVKDLSGKQKLFWGILFPISFFALLYSVSAFSLTIPFLALLAFRMLCRSGKQEQRAWLWLLRSVDWFLTVPFEWIAFFSDMAKGEKNDSVKILRILKWLVLWLIPILLTIPFFLMFMSANPIIERIGNRFMEWISKLSFPSFAHTCFWGITFIVLVGLTSMKFWLRREDTVVKFAYPVVHGGNFISTHSMFVAQTMTRGLILFNLLFLIQNIFDIEYLWAGLALPNGVSYAEYAHRGAYPLIATALLAGALTIFTFQEKSRGPEWKWARLLVYLWLLQNIFLVASSLLRLEKYIAVYSLTQLRVAAIFWMLLVGAGLFLILYKVWRNKSLNWLIWSNGGALLLLSVFVLFFDINAVIAEYNLANCREVKGKTKEGILPAPLDTAYLRTLGDSALPTLIKAETKGIRISKGPHMAAEMLRLKNELGNWRTFSPHKYMVFRKATDLQ